MPPSEQPDSTENVLDVAEQLFLERGYAGTRVRDLADRLGMKPASLYYHAPGGKKELWDRVLTRALTRHEVQLRAAADAFEGDIRAQLIAMATWLLSQPPVNLVALATSRVYGAEAGQESAKLMGRMEQSLLKPVGDVFQSAQEAGILRVGPPNLLSGMFVAAINPLKGLAQARRLDRPVQDVVEDVVDVMLHGALLPE
ncbi:MAG: TetR/AcrR family transcriptional regulator [Bacteroidota bacterium]